MYLLENIDSIYASGMFCKVGPPGSRDDHYEVISSMRDMLGELAVARESALESKSPIFHARRYVEISPSTPSIGIDPTSGGPRLLAHRITSRPPVQSPTQSQIPMSERLDRELQHHTKAAKRSRHGKAHHLAPTFENIDKIYTLLSTSLEFFDDAKEWHGMPWWRNPQAELKPFLMSSGSSCASNSYILAAPVPFPASTPVSESDSAIDVSPPSPNPFDSSDFLPRGSQRSDPSVVTIELLRPGIQRRKVSFNEDEKPSSPVVPSLDRVPCRPFSQSPYRFPAS